MYFDGNRGGSDIVVGGERREIMAQLEGRGLRYIYAEPKDDCFPHSHIDIWCSVNF